MRASFLKFLLPALLALACTPGPKAGTEAVNPLTYTDIPDNDLIRVGDSYYMVSTTMYFCPGAPIMRSEDLVHWRIVGYVYDSLGDDAIYRMEDGRNAYGKGQWATSLTYHDGWYYVLFVANEYHQTYVFKTRDIENGPWERTVVRYADAEEKRPAPFYHDASMLWEGDRLFVVYGNGNLFLVELDPRTFHPLSEPECIIESPVEGWMLRAEGSRFYHIGDYYYILTIDWPAGGLRTETAWRSKTIRGPYERKVVLQGKMEDNYNSGVAQGGMVQTRYGDWYAIMFQDHGAVGRIPTVQPVSWVDGWPIMGDKGVPMKKVNVRLAPSGENRSWASDGFSSEKLDLVWQWNHMPADSLWSLSERPGCLRLKAGIPAADILRARNSLTQRTAGPSCSSEVKLDLGGLMPGDRAGICAFQSNNCSIGIELSEDGSRSVVVREMLRTQRGPGMNASAAHDERVVFAAPYEGDSIYLRITYDFQTDSASPDLASFAYGPDGSNWTQIPDYQLVMRFTLDLFTGYRTALYCYNPAGPGGYADFDFFHQQIL